MAKKNLTLEEKLEEAIVKDGPYEVSGNWVWIKLGNIIKVSSGKGLTAKQMDSTGDIPVYGGNGFIGYHNEFIFDSHKIIIGRVGANCGNVHLTDKKSWITDNALIASYDTESINRKFLYYLLKINDLGQYSMSSAQPVISGAKIYSIPVQLPPLKEQQRIVDKIESLFEKLDKAAELIEEAREGFEKRKSASMYKILDMSTSEKISLKKCIKFVTEKKEPEDGDIYIGLENMKRDSGIICYGIAEDVKSTKTKFKAGDVLYGRLRPYLNKHDVVDRDGICSTDILVMRINNGYNSAYINYMLDTLEFIRYSNENSSGINLPRVSSKIVGEYLIPDINLDRQIEVVRIFDGLYQKEREIEELTQLEEQIELIKKSILAKAFRGELGTNCEEDESALELLKEILSKE